MVNDNLSVNGGANWSIGTGISPSAARWIDGVLIRFQERMVRVSMDNGQTWIDLAELGGDVPEAGFFDPGIVGVSSNAIVFSDNGTTYYRVALDDITSRLP
jgi:hypothetical protein